MHNDEDTPRAVEAIAQDMLELLIDLRETPPPVDWKQRRDRLIDEARDTDLDTSLLPDRAERWG